jgi:hypothetical protein
MQPQHNKVRICSVDGFCVATPLQQKSTSPKGRSFDISCHSYHLVAYLNNLITFLSTPKIGKQNKKCQPPIHSHHPSRLYLSFHMLVSKRPSGGSGGGAVGGEDRGTDMRSEMQAKPFKILGNRGGKGQCQQKGMCIHKHNKTQNNG